MLFPLWEAVSPDFWRGDPAVDYFLSRLSAWTPPQSLTSHEDEVPEQAALRAKLVVLASMSNDRDPSGTFGHGKCLGLSNASVLVIQLSLEYLTMYHMIPLVCCIRRAKVQSDHGDAKGSEI